jgi:hypothetical protein
MSYSNEKVTAFFIVNYIIQLSKRVAYHFKHSSRIYTPEFCSKTQYYVYLNTIYERPRQWWIDRVAKDIKAIDESKNLENSEELSRLEKFRRSCQEPSLKAL